MRKGAATAFAQVGREQRFFDVAVGRAVSPIA